MTKKASKEKYSTSIYAREGYCFYMCNGVWRVGERGIAASRMEKVKDEILAELEAFNA